MTVVEDRLPVRPDALALVDDAWDRLGEPGTWWDASDRCAIASEVRAARACALCRSRKEAVSPYAVYGTHDAVTALDPVVVDAVHRIETDAGRLTKRFFDTVSAVTGVEAYVELVAIVAVVAAADVLARAANIEPRELPAPRPGAPSRERPVTVPGEGWVPTIDVSTVSGFLAEEYGNGRASGIMRSLSLVPAEAEVFLRVRGALFLETRYVQDWTSTPPRALSRAQMEVVSTTVASLSNCFY